MKYLFTLLFLLSTISMNAQLLTEPDKRKHFTAGAVFGGITYGVILQETEDKKLALAGSILAAFTVGYLKETEDKKSGYTFDDRDLLATTLGGLSIGITFDIFVREGKKRKGFFNFKKNKLRL